MRRGPIPYSASELEWLEENRGMIISDYHRAFVAAFGRHDVKASHLHLLRKRKRWLVGRTPGRFAGRRQKFTAEEIAWLRDNATMPVSQYRAGFLEAFGHDMSVAALNSLRKREGFRTGRTGHFEPGHISHNKGQRCPEGTGGRHPNARKTQFKKGQVAPNYLGEGHERIDAQDGYVVMIVDEPNPWTGAKTRPVHKHRWLWEQANGPVPDGHVLKCLDGDKTNTDPSNWEAIPREVLPRLNGRFGMGYDAAPAEIKPVLMTLGKLKHAVKLAKDRSA